jgi:ribonucleoside-diphosphate reductase alpha chain
LGLGFAKEVMEHGVRNSYCGANANRIYSDFGEQRSFEPYTSNIYTRRVLSGEFIVVNKHLLHDLVERGLWNETLKQECVTTGSVQALDIPQDLKRIVQNRLGNVYERHY